MILTDEKIKVTHEMMERNNMTRGNQYGIPVDLNNLSRGLRWKAMFDLTEQDFDTLEEYFIQLEKRKNDTAREN